MKKGFLLDQPSPSPGKESVQSSSKEEEKDQTPPPPPPPPIRGTIDVETRSEAGGSVKAKIGLQIENHREGVNYTVFEMVKHTSEAPAKDKKKKKGSKKKTESSPAASLLLPKLLHKVEPSQIVLGEDPTRASYTFEEPFAPASDVSLMLGYREEGKVQQCGTTTFTTPPTVPCAPEPPGVMSKTSSTIKVKWKKPDDCGSKISAYELEVLRNESTVHDSYSGPETMYKVAGLDAGEAIKCRVRARNTVGWSEWSLPAALRTSPGVPLPPTVPHLKHRTHAEISFEWKPPADVRGASITGYSVQILRLGPVPSRLKHLKVFKSEDQFFQQRDDWELCADVDEERVVVDGLAPEHVYGFRVAAENAVGQSTFCNPVYFQTQGTPPSVPRNLRTMGEKQGEGKGSKALQRRRAEASRTDPSLENSSALGSEKSVVIQWQIPEELGVSQAVEDVEQKSDSVVVYELQSCDLYEVFESEGGKLARTQSNAKPVLSQPQVEWSLHRAKGRYWSDTYRGPNTTYTLHNLRPGSALAFRVRASNVHGSSKWSDAALASTESAAPDAPEELAVSNVTPSSANVTWQEASGNGSPILYYTLFLRYTGLEVKPPTIAALQNPKKTPIPRMLPKPPPSHPSLAGATRIDIVGTARIGHSGRTADSKLEQSNYENSAEGEGSQNKPWYPGKRVDALFEDGLWYSAVIDSVHMDETDGAEVYEVEFMGYGNRTRVKEPNLRERLSVGDRCLAVDVQQGTWEEAKVDEVGDEGYTVYFTSGQLVSLPSAAVKRRDTPEEQISMDAKADLVLDEEEVEVLEQSEEAKGPVSWRSALLAKPKPKRPKPSVAASKDLGESKESDNKAPETTTSAEPDSENANNGEDDNSHQGHTRLAKLLSGKWQAVWKGKGTKCQLKTLVPGRSFEAQVVATNTMGHSPPSSSVTIVSACGKPLSPSAPRLVSVSPNSCVISPGDIPDTGGEALKEWVLELGRGETEKRGHSVTANLPSVVFNPWKTYGAGPNLAVSSPLLLEGSSGKRILHPDDHAHTQEEPIRVTGLEPGRLYWLRIAGVTAQGRGPFSPALAARTAPLPPACPQRLEVNAVAGETQGEDTIEIDWRPPSDSCGSKLRGYHLQCQCVSQNGENIPLTAPSMDPESIELLRELGLQEDLPEEGGFTTVYVGLRHFVQLSPVEPSAKYTFRVQALSSSGPGSWSPAESIITPEDLPTRMPPPTLQHAAPKKATVAWDPPSSSVVLSYSLQVLLCRVPDEEYLRHHHDDVSDFADGEPSVYFVEGTKKQQVISKLQPDTVYALRIAGGNGRGQGKWSKFTLFQTPKMQVAVPEPPATIHHSEPEAPKALCEALNPGEAVFLGTTLSWPIADGKGWPVKSYRVNFMTDGEIVTLYEGPKKELKLALYAPGAEPLPRYHKQKKAIYGQRDGKNVKFQFQVDASNKHGWSTKGRDYTIVLPATAFVNTKVIVETQKDLLRKRRADATNDPSLVAKAAATGVANLKKKQQDKAQREKRKKQLQKIFTLAAALVLVALIVMVFFLTPRQ